MLDIIRERKRLFNQKVGMTKKTTISSTNTTQQDESIHSDYSEKIEIEEKLVISDIVGGSFTKQPKLIKRLTIFFMKNLVKEVVKYYWDLFEAI